MKHLLLIALLLPSLASAYDIHYVAEPCKKYYPPESFLAGCVRYNTMRIEIDETLTDEQKVFFIRHEICHTLTYKHQRKFRGLENIYNQPMEETICDVFPEWIASSTSVTVDWSSRFEKRCNIECVEEIRSITI